MQNDPLKSCVRAVLAGGALSLSLSTAAATDWTEGHGDIAVNHVVGEWRFGVIIDSFPGTEFAPHEVLIKAGDTARLAIPAGPNFGFLGTPGDPVWIYPQSQAAGVPFIGISAEATPLGTFASDRFDLQLGSVSGPGDFFLWTTGGTGTPTVQMNSADGISAADVFDVPSGGHNHMNWGFSSPGTYRVGFNASGTLTGQPSPTTSDEAVYTFEVSVLKGGDVDVDVAYEEGELHLGVHDEVTDTEFEAAHVALQAGPLSWGRVPAGAAFGFLGEPGDEVLILPQAERAGLLFLGIAGEEIPAGTFVNDAVALYLVAVSGPGNLALYRTDAFGAPTVFFNSADGITATDTFPVAVGAHTHANWAFSQPGLYRVQLQATGTLAAGGTAVSSAPATFLFEVFAPTVLDRGDVDVDVAYANGELELGVHQEATDTEFSADKVILRARAPARSRVPANPQFAFLGTAGTTTYVLPQEEHAGLLFLGITGEEIAAGMFQDERVALNLVGLTGPGQLALYSVDGFGSPTVFLNSANGLSAVDTVPVAVGTHTHLNWAFSQPGVYEVQLQAAGALTTGGLPVQSEIVTFRFEIVAPLLFDEGEIDFEIVYADGEWETVLLNEAVGREFETDEAWLVAKPAAKQLVPADPAFAFLGTAGSPVHILPQDETEGLLFPGIAADEIAPGLFVNETLNLMLTAANGPGEFALYEVDAFGAPTVFMNTRGGLSTADVFPVAVGSHSHVNWAFSTPGEYTLTFKAAGTLAAGGTLTESADVTLSFLIQDTGPVLTATTANGGATLRIGWASKTGVSYQLQSRTSLTAGNWNDHGEPVAGDGLPKSVDTPVTNDPLKVFQVIEVQP